jgi:hypothetical protein
MPNPDDRGEFGGEFGGDYARDTHRGGLSDEYARDGGWSGAGRADDYTREPDRPSDDDPEESIGKASE